MVQQFINIVHGVCLTYDPGYIGYFERVFFQGIYQAFISIVKFPNNLSFSLPSNLLFPEK